MRFHIHSNGYEAMAWFFPFDGGTHRFNDQSHAKNFVRYLFSRSKAHPSNHLTIRNLVCENTGETITRQFLVDPDAMLEDFMARRFPASGAVDRLCDDGFYTLFAVRLPDGRAFSNAFVTEGDEIQSIHGLVSMIGQIGISQSEFEADAETFCAKGPVADFEAENDPAILKPIDSILQGIAHRRIEGAGDVILTVSHRDQLDHNQCWHIHRLIALKQKGKVHA